MLLLWLKHNTSSTEQVQLFLTAIIFLIFNIETVLIVTITKVTDLKVTKPPQVQPLNLCY
jgi:NADH:ubiquinone oxidoreductase subunit 3 (subunit A)